MLSYIEGGIADAWKEGWYDIHLDTEWGTFKDFLDKFIEAFKAIDKPGDALHKMKTIGMNRNETAEEYTDQFKNWVTDSGLKEDLSVIDYYRTGLPKQLRDKILNCETPPTTIKDWYKKAIQFDNNWRKSQAITNLLRSQNPPNTTNNRPGRRMDFRPRNIAPQYVPRQNDPMAMDIDMTRTDQDEHFKKGLCFYCHQQGHRARECPQKTRNSNIITPRTNNSYNSRFPAPAKQNAIQTHATIRAMINELAEEEKEEFFQQAEKEGF